MICRGCQNEHDPTAGRLCAHCGIAVLPPTPEQTEQGEARTPRCPRCGARAELDAARCRVCGNPLPETEAETGDALVEPHDSLRELELVPGPPVEIARGPVAMSPVEAQSRDVDLAPGPPIGIADTPVKMTPPELREVELE